MKSLGWLILLILLRSTPVVPTLPADCSVESVDSLSNACTNDCTADSGYTGATGVPSKAQMDKMCKSSSCKQFVALLLASDPAECTLPTRIKLRADLLDKVAAHCKSTWGNLSSTRSSDRATSAEGSTTGSRHKKENTTGSSYKGTQQGSATGSSRKATKNPMSVSNSTANNAEPRQKDAGSRHATTTGSSAKATDSKSFITIAVVALVVIGLVVSGFVLWRKTRGQPLAQQELVQNGVQPQASHDRTTSPHTKVDYKFSSETMEFRTEPTDRCVRARKERTSRWTDHSVPSTSGVGASHHHTRLDIEDQELLRDPELLAIQIPLQTLTQHERIGQGAFAEVFKGSLDGRVVAIKRLKSEIIPGASSHSTVSLLTEVRLLGPLNHPNLVKLIGVAWKSQSLASSLCVVSEFMNRGDLRRLLQEFSKSGHPKAFDKLKLGIALDVACGLKYLHAQSPKVIHRDLKSRNILLNDQLQAKLTDFGISRVSNEETMTMTAGAGTNLWMAPEVVIGEPYNEKADIFSFGVVLSELDTHLLPYAAAIHSFEKENGRQIAECAILQNVTSGDFRVGFTHKAEEDAVVALRWLVCS